MTETQTNPTSELEEKRAAVMAEVNAKLDEIKKIKDKDQLAAMAKELGWEDDPAKVNVGWLQRKIGRLYQDQALRNAGLSPSQSIADANAKHDSAAKTTGSADKEKKVGRKRMKTGGNYRLSLGSDGAVGRQASVKGRILQYLKDLGEGAIFDYPKFAEAVVHAMNYKDGVFGVDTKFGSIELATSAWFSELKNKRQLIVDVGAPTATEEATPAQ